MCRVYRSTLCTTCRAGASRACDEVTGVTGESGIAHSMCAALVVLRAEVT